MSFLIAFPKLIAFSSNQAHLYDYFSFSTLHWKSMCSQHHSHQNIKSNPDPLLVWEKYKSIWIILFATNDLWIPAPGLSSRSSCRKKMGEKIKTRDVFYSFLVPVTMFQMWAVCDCSHQEKINESHHEGVKSTKMVPLKFSGMMLPIHINSYSHSQWQPENKLIESKLLHIIWVHLRKI